MDNVDIYVERAEEDANGPRVPPRKSTELERIPTATTTSSSSTASSALSEPVCREIGTGTGSGVRMGIESERSAAAVSSPSLSSEQPDRHQHHGRPTHLERSSTALSRIHTQRSQHSGTVGSSSTLKTRVSRRALPGFGAGKPYPPPLPEREEYVVEFDGEQDPRHAMNWPLSKKYVDLDLPVLVCIVEMEYRSRPMSMCDGAVAAQS